MSSQRGLVVVGYLGEVAGDEGHIVEHQPVVEAEAALYMPSVRTDGRVELTQLSNDDERYIHRIPREQATNYVEGSFLWLAGPAIVSEVGRFAALREMSQDLVSWDTLSRGFRWSQSSIVEMRARLARYAVDLEAHINRLLFDRMEFTHGDVGPAFDLYRALALEDTADRALVVGMIHYCNRDDRRYRLTGMDAVVRRHFADFPAFDSEIKKRVTRLKSERPADLSSRIEVADNGRIALRSLLLSDASVSVDNGPQAQLAKFWQNLAGVGESHANEDATGLFPQARFGSFDLPSERRVK